MNGLCDSFAGLAFAVMLQIGQATEIARVYPDLGEKLRLSKIKDAVNLDFQFMQPEPDFRRDYRLAAAQVKSHLRECALSQQRCVKNIEGAVIPSVSAAEEKGRTATFARNPPDPTFKRPILSCSSLSLRPRSLDPAAVGYKYPSASSLSRTRKISSVWPLWIRSIARWPSSWRCRA